MRLFFGKFPGTGPVLVRPVIDIEIFLFWAGMGMMAGGCRRLLLRVVRRMGCRVLLRVVRMVIPVPALVLTPGRVWLIIFPNDRRGICR